MSEIKHCPFCAHDEITLVPSIVDDDYYNAQCVRCGARGPTAGSETRAVEKWNGRRETYPLAQADIDAYEDLRNATPEQLLEAMIWSIRQSVAVPELADQMVSFLRVGWRLARPGGWMNITPMWLRESKRLAALDE